MNARVTAAREGTGVALGGVALGLLITAPVWGAPRDRVLAMPDSEVYSGVWVLDWAQRTLLATGLPPAFAPELNWPHGRGLHALPVWEALLTLPLRPLVTPVLLYNVVCVLQIAVAFGAAWLVMRDHTPSPRVALPGALAFATTPALLGALQGGPIETYGVGWLALALWAVPRAREGGAARVVGAGIALGATFLSNPYHFVFASCAGLWLGLSAGPVRPVLGRVLAVGLVAAVLAAPQAWAIQTSLHGTSAPWVHASAEESRRLFEIDHVQDLVSFVWPTPAYYRPGPTWRVYLGVVVLGLGLAGLRVRGAKRWGTVALAGALYAPGAYLVVAGTRLTVAGHPLPLPALLLNQLPPFSSVHHPFRVVPLVVLALGVLGTRWLEALPPARLRLAVPLAGLGLLVDHFVLAPTRLPLTAADVTVPAFYLGLAADPDDYAVLDYTSAKAPLNFGRPMLYQAYHHKSVLFDVRPPDREVLANSVVGLAQWDPSVQPPPRIPPTLCADARALGALGVRYVVKHHWDDAPDARWDALLACGLPVAYQDAQVTALRLR